MKKYLLLLLLCLLCLTSCNSSSLYKTIDFINGSDTTCHFDLGKTNDAYEIPYTLIHKKNQDGFEYYSEDLSYRYVFTKHPKLGNKEVLTYFYTCDENAYLFGKKIGEPYATYPTKKLSADKPTIYLDSLLKENGFKLIPHKKGTKQEIYFEGSNKYIWVCYESDEAFVNFSYNYNSNKHELHKFQIGLL